MKKILVLIELVILILPFLGIIVLKAEYTSADLSDEVKVKSNSLKATTLSIAIQNTVDNTSKPYFVNLRRFQKDSLEATTIRIRNVGEEETKYFLTVKESRKDVVCDQPNIKILKDDKVIFSDNLSRLNLEMPKINKGEKNDLILLLSLDTELSSYQPTICEYQLEVSTNNSNKELLGFHDLKKIDGQMEILPNN